MTRLPLVTYLIYRCKVYINFLVFRIFTIFAPINKHLMRIKSQYKVREMAGEYVVIMQGQLGSNLTKIISLNESALYLWRAIEGKEFNEVTITNLLAEHYGIDSEVAQRDAMHWIDRLEECGLVEE